MSELFEIPVNDIDGKPCTLADYRGQVLLIVNVASRCGLTPQYSGLQALQDKYAARGFTVLGFPCNDFANQEPEDESAIKSFCETSFQVSFPLFSKITINNKPRHPLYAALIDAIPNATPAPDGTLMETLEKHNLQPAKDTDVMWNFEKFLIGKDGTVIGRFAPDVTPDSAQLTGAIENALA
ncbi:redoxin domain-containing protein [Granulosicoccaceae sp. 1_MG-2023]|nr:redoxin domain-containing protein [Granulosicoccaceae sp. 1_MG-2023]